jgi:hypothetical protein
VFQGPYEIPLLSTRGKILIDLRFGKGLQSTERTFPIGRPVPLKG